MDDLTLLLSSVLGRGVTKNGVRGFVLTLSITMVLASEDNQAMEVHPFQGTLNVQEVVCSGDFLSPETEVMMMSLYTESDQKEVAFVNIPERQCLTYGGFSSCVINKNRSRKTKLKALVTDIPVGGSRKYGCRLTVVRSRREVDIVSKSVVARRHSLKTSNFLNAHNLLEVSCSGEKLPSSVDLLSMSLYEILSYGRQRTLASVNFGAKKCLTNSSFSSCTIDEGNSRRTQLRSIVVDLEGTTRGELRHYGCNVTGFQSGGKTPTFAWSISARAKRKRAQITRRV